MIRSRAKFDGSSWNLRSSVKFAPSSLILPSNFELRTSFPVSKNRSPHPHDRRAFFDRHLEVFAHAHREVFDADAVTHRAQHAEVAARFIGRADGRNRHQPTKLNVLQNRDL